MQTADLDYQLPESLIAQFPANNREDARLLVLDRKSRSIHEDVFRNVASYLESGDCVVVNDTRVIRARLMGRKKSGGQVEIFLLKPLEPGAWEALVRPSSRVKPGTTVQVGEDIECVVAEEVGEGRRRVRFDRPDVLSVLESSGEIPLPPYIRRDEADERDTSRYQTVYAEHPGAVAAPTAGLHFTPEVFEQLKAKGVRRGSLTLHVGYGTFKPVQATRLEDHQVDPEEFVFPEETAESLNRVRSEGGRIVAVGTTTTRVLETQYCDGQFLAGEGVTRYCIYPPHTFRSLDVMLTNFHLPRTSLLALACAFGGTELVLEAYRHAVENEFRFYSYGDAMLIL